MKNPIIDLEPESSILLNIPEVPPVQAIPGMLVLCKGGVLTIRKGGSNRRSEMTFTLSEAIQLSAAIQQGIKQELFLPSPEGKEPGYAERPLDDGALANLKRMIAEGDSKPSEESREG
ncbi:hypothetical protein SAMN02745166_01513 [Prosthecobacter debontii]|uniref:Uncharacterized protein n=1 Tax=Prosthecobacter debontii TaxID=48467 RepID=A0A1T4XIN1_9BACT|nr:hypothetical protein [Prosthecobacter debontii]SKA88951.1 hypothetical protein SAMN02745166_01513 [Prosthecobacter debontii]